MASKKKYAEATFYESKLKKVMARFDVDTDSYNWDYNRHGGFVEFYYKGQLYRFDHSVEKARQSGEDIAYGSDVFAQIVLALEDLARLVQRGIYDLQTWVAGMKQLPATVSIPSFFATLGFDKIPDSEKEIDKQYKKMALVMHPDAGGSNEDFNRLTEAKEQAINFISHKQG